MAESFGLKISKTHIQENLIEIFPLLVHVLLSWHEIKLKQRYLIIYIDYKARRNSYSQQGPTGATRNAIAFWPCRWISYSVFHHRYGYLAETEGQELFSFPRSVPISVSSDPRIFPALFIIQVGRFCTK